MDLAILLFAFFLFCFMLVKLFKRSSFKLPPGPRGLPIIGNLHQLKGGPMHRVLRDMSEKYGPLFHLKFGEVSLVIVCSPEAAKEMFKKNDVVLSNRPRDMAVFDVMTYNLSGIATSPYGNYWKQVRKICMLELLSSKRVKMFGSIRDGEIKNFIQFVASQEGNLVNLSERSYALTYRLIARAAFGKVSTQQKLFKENMDKCNDLIRGLDIADLYPSMKFLRVITGVERKLRKMFKEVDQILQTIVDEHKEEILIKKSKSQSGGEPLYQMDIVDVLLSFQNSDEIQIPMTDDKIKAVILDIFSAGGDTSASTIEWALSETIKNPEVLKRAQDEVRKVFYDKGDVDESGFTELNYLQAIIKETLRLHPPAPLALPRECSEKCNVYGYDIPAKTRVLVNVWAIGRDSKYWSEPETFKPERFLDSLVDYKGNDFEYLPFGVGRRVCPGTSFAIPNITLALAQLMFHFDWKLPDEGKIDVLDMIEHPVLEGRRKNELKLIPVIYERSYLKNQPHPESLTY